MSALFCLCHVVVIKLDAEEEQVIERSEAQKSELQNATALHFFDRPGFPTTLATVVRRTEDVENVCAAAVVRPVMHLGFEQFKWRFVFVVFYEAFGSGEE